MQLLQAPTSRLYRLYIDTEAYCDDCPTASEVPYLVVTGEGNGCAQAEPLNTHRKALMSLGYNDSDDSDDDY